MINLIDETGKFNQHLHEFPNSQANIAIFGSQSSGKSTLMNASFETHFPILNTREDRKRCTRGIWFQNNGKFNIIDTEGFDSAQRMENQRIFQRQIALFCLAVADVIIVNIWMNQIGRYQGGQMQILKSIINAAGYLVQSQTKTLLFVVKDCSRDADPDILKYELESEIQKIMQQCSRKDSKPLKLNIEYYFMSHYIYQPDEYQKQAKKLPSVIKVRKSALNQHDPKDRIVYLNHLWDTILANEGEIDLRMEEEAIRSYVVCRIRAEVRQKIKDFIEVEDKIGKRNSYEGFYRFYVKKGFQQIKARMPKYLQQKIIKTQFFLLQQQLQYIIHTHFSQQILPKQQQSLLSTLTKQLQKSNNSIQLQKQITQIRKKVLQAYKIIVKGHKQSNILVKRFSQKITQQSVQFQRQVSHLFNMFQTKLEMQINKELDRQVGKLKFEGEKLTEKVKALCKQFQYNEWELNTKEIFEKVSHRVLIQKLNQKIDQFSSSQSYSIFGSDNQATIISSYKQTQKKVQKFIASLLLYFQQEDTGQQYIQKSNEKLRQCLEVALVREKRRFRLSMLMLGVLLLFLYGEFMWVLKFAGTNKRIRKNLGNLYLVVAAVIIVGSIAKRVMRSVVSAQVMRGVVSAQVRNS